MSVPVVLLAYALFAVYAISSAAVLVIAIRALFKKTPAKRLWLASVTAALTGGATLWLVPVPDGLMLPTPGGGVDWLRVGTLLAIGVGVLMASLLVASMGRVSGLPSESATEVTVLRPLLIAVVLGTIALAVLAFLWLSPPPPLVN